MISTKKNIATINFKFLFKAITAFLVSLSSITTYCQDLHFTQYTNAPLLTNPANTGFAPDCDYRLGFNSRTQWAASNVPYKTISAWGDAQLFQKKLNDSWLGVGAVFLNDVAGTGNLTSIKNYLSIAYHQYLSNTSLLSIGFGGGLVQKRVDVTKLTFDAQWNDKFFDIDLPNQEPFIGNNASYADLSLGINYSWFTSDKFYLNGGVSVQHLNTPKETFFNPNTVDARLARRYNAFINASIKLSDVTILNPHVYYSQMSKSTETVIGLDGQYNLSGVGGTTQLLLAFNYRNKDAVSPGVGIQLGNTQFMFNYDATTSSLKTYSNYRNAYEFSLVWKGMYDGTSAAEKSVRCSSPKF